MEKMPTVVINVSGGLIQCVNSDVPVRVIVIDEDTDGADEDSLVCMDGADVVLSDYALTEISEGADGNLYDGLAPRYVQAIAEEADQLTG